MKVFSHQMQCRSTEVQLLLLFITALSIILFQLFFLFVSLVTFLKK